MNYFKKRGNAFRFAFQGLKAAFSEAHLTIHLLALLFVVVLAFYFQVSKTDWCILILCSSMVICLELVNSAGEKLCDLISTEYHPKIKFVKDVLAGAVLIAAFAALVIGCIVFYPYLFA